MRAFRPLSQSTRRPAKSWLRGSTQRRSLSASHVRRSAASQSGLREILRISDEVRDALQTGKPVVALESTIYTHGAIGSDLGLESIVREHGAVPAVIGVLDGAPTVGLSPAEIECMVSEGARKVSRRDLAYLVGMGMLGRSSVHGGTTVAGTMLLARLAGIKVFGTGGLGGVHRGWETSLDISADLTELGKTRVAVVSSGCKGFLDIPATLEYLETQGVLVSTFSDGPAERVGFPAFWARASGVESPSVVHGEREAAAMILAQERLGIEAGLLFANPIPQEHEIPRRDMDAAIDRAVSEAADQRFSGNENTPFILRRIKELTHGRSVSANKALVQANVARAAKIAVELSLLSAGGKHTAFQPQFPKVGDLPHHTQHNSPIHSGVTKEEPHSKVDILVAGSVALDLNCDFAVKGSAGKEATPTLHTSNPAVITQTVGGVGHNVALAAHRMSRNTNVRLCSIVGDDIAGATILSELQMSGMDTSFIRRLGHEYHSARTAQYVAVNDGSKNLVVAMADMGILTSHSFSKYWASAVAASRPSWLVVDGNWCEHDMQTWIRNGRKHHAKVGFEPVSTYKATRLFPRAAAGRETSHARLLLPTPLVDLATPNSLELASMYQAAKDNGYFESAEWFGIIDAFGMRGARDRFVRLTSADITDKGIPQQAVHLLPFIPMLLTKLGPRGVLLTMILSPSDPRLRDPDAEPFILARNMNDHPHVGGIYMRLFPAVEEVTDVVSVNGVGDTFMGALIAGLVQGGTVEELVDIAQRAAVMTLRSHQAVSEELGKLEAELMTRSRIDGGRIE